MKGRHVLALAVVGAALFLGYLWLGSNESPETTARSTSAHAPSAAPTRTKPPASAKDKRSELSALRLSPPRVKVTKSEAADGKASFSGRVISSRSGDGIAQAELTLAEAQSTHTVITGADGRFTFDAPSAGIYQVAAVTAEGFAPFAPAWGQSPLTLSARPGRRVDDIIIALRPQKSISGTVVNNEGEPVPDAEVKVYTPSGPLLQLALAGRADLDTSGRFTVQAPEGAILEATHPDYAPATVRLSADDVDAGRVTLRLGGTDAGLTAAIAGIVVDENDNPLPEVPVTAQLQRNVFREEPDLRLTLTDVDGKFTFDRLQSAAYTLSASSPDHAPVRLRDVPAGTSDVVLRAEAAGGHIEGRVSAAGPGAVSSFVVVVSRPLGRIQEVTVATRTFVDPEGRYRVGPFAAGTYRVRAVAPGFATSAAATADVTVGATETVDLTLTPGATVVGTVVSADEKKPISGAQVQLESSFVGANLPIPVDKTATTDPQGRFTIRGIASGLFSVVGSADGYNRRAVSGQRAIDGQTTGPIVIELSALDSPDDRPKIELAGIGAALAPQGDVVMIGQVIDKGGAAEAGLRPGDSILSIDGEAVAELDFNGIIQRIRGPVDTQVALRVRRADGSEETLAVPRRAIKL